MITKRIILLIHLLVAIIISCKQNSDTRVKTQTISKDSLPLSANVVYTGKAYRERWYDCSLKILSNDSVVFVAHTDKNTIYFEEFGKIEQVKDSIYLIRAQKFFFSGPMEDHDFNDSLYLFCDSLLSVSSIKLIYSNKQEKTIKIKSPHSNLSFDKKLFNEKYEYLGIDIKHVDPIRKEPVIFNAWFGSAYTIYKGNTSEYYFVILKGNSLWTIDTAPMQTGYLNLKIKKEVKREEQKPFFLLPH